MVHASPHGPGDGGGPERVRRGGAAGKRGTVGKGGAAGFAKGGASVRLAPSGEGTTLSYDVEAKVGGKLAQLGSRIIDGFAKKMADQFFERFQQAVEGPAEPDDGAPDSEDGGTAKKGWLKRLVGQRKEEAS